MRAPGRWLSSPSEKGTEAFGSGDEMGDQERWLVGLLRAERRGEGGGWPGGWL